MALKNTFIYLIGFPATGKYTIAKELCKLEPSIKLVDNHLINNPIFSVLELDGKTKLPDQVWQNVDKIRDIVLDSIVKLSAKETSFIFTNHLIENDEHDLEQYYLIKKTALARGAYFLPVHLKCSVEELEKRIDSDERAVRFKMTDKSAVRPYAEKFNVLKIREHNGFELDVSLMFPKEAALEILEKCP